MINRAVPVKRFRYTKKGTEYDKDVPEQKGNRLWNPDHKISNIRTAFNSEITLYCNRGGKV